MQLTLTPALHALHSSVLCACRSTRRRIHLGALQLQLGHSRPNLPRMSLLVLLLHACVIRADSGMCCRFVDPFIGDREEKKLNKPRRAGFDFVQAGRLMRQAEGQRLRVGRPLGDNVGLCSTQAQAQP